MTTRRQKQTNKRDRANDKKSSSSRHFLIPISLAVAGAYQSINTSKESPTTQSTPPTRHIIIEVHKQTEKRKKGKDFRQSGKPPNTSRALVALYTVTATKLVSIMVQLCVCS